MITLMIILNITVALMCWTSADNFEPWTIAWILLLGFSAWNAVEAISAIITY